MADDHFQTIAAPVEARIKVERSEFLARAVPATSETEFFSELEKVQKAHFDATHHCWAFRLFGGRERSSDAGEPSGSAGRPILSALESAALFDCGVVVTRWYGGVKLGTGGLGRAYRGAAADALAAADRKDRYCYVRVEVIAPFEALSTVYRLPEPPSVLLVGEEFTERNRFLFDVRRSMVEGFVSRLVERRLEARALDG